MSVKKIVCFCTLISLVIYHYFYTLKLLLHVYLLDRNGRQLFKTESDTCYLHYHYYHQGLVSLKFSVTEIQVRVGLSVFYKICLSSAYLWEHTAETCYQTFLLPVFLSSGTNSFDTQLFFLRRILNILFGSLFVM